MSHSNQFYYSANPPANPRIGDRWLDSTTGDEYVFIYDGNTHQWIQPASVPFFGPAPGDPVVENPCSCCASSKYGTIAENVGNFSQGTANSLFLKITDIDGCARSAEDVKITISKEDSYTDPVVDLVKTSTVQEGYYFYEWVVDVNAVAGKYTITWSYLLEGEEHYTVQTVIVSEKPDSENAYWGIVNDLRVALEYHIRSAMNIPVYFEQAKPSKDKKCFKFTFPRWNQSAGVRVYRNQEIVENGVVVNYFKGEVNFSQPLSSYDVVNCDYNFRWFEDGQLYRFLQAGLQRYNFFPAVSYYTLDMIPDRAVTPVLYAATIDALREMMMSLQFQEPQLVFGSTERAQNVFSNLDTLKKNYEESLKAMLDAKKNGPYAGLTKMIVTPEYTLPGGRSRWFRYMFTGSNI